MMVEQQKDMYKSKASRLTRVLAEQVGRLGLKLIESMAPVEGQKQCPHDGSKGLMPAEYAYYSCARFI